MKKMFAVLAMSMLAGLTVAAPKASWIAADADMAIAILNVNTQNDAMNQAWSTALKEAGVQGVQDVNHDQPWAAALPNDVKATLTKMGIDVNAKTLPISSLLLTLKNIKDQDPEAFIFIETALQLEKIAQGLKDDPKNANLVIGKTEQGWTTFADKTATDGKAVAARQFDGGIAVTAVPSTAKADALLKAAAPATPSPLATVLDAKTPYGELHLKVKDLSEGCKTMDLDMTSTPEQPNPLPNMKAVTVDIASRNLDAVLKLNVANTTAEAAQQLKGMFDGYKMMVLMMAPSTGLSADSECLKFLQKLNVTTTAENATLEVVFAPRETARLIKECQTLAENNDAAPQIDTVEVLETVEEEPAPLSPEAAKKVLDDATEAE